MRKFMWTLTIVLLLLAPGALAQTSVDESKTANADGTVEISNVSGSLQIIGWDKPEIHITGTLEKNVERLDFDVRDGRSMIKVVIPKFASRHTGADLTIQLPLGSVLEVETVSASVTVNNPVSLSQEQGMAEKVQIKSVSGEIEMKSSANNVLLETVSGDVHVGTKAKEVTLKSVSGEVIFSGTADNLRTESVSGDLSQGGVIGALTAKTISGTITAKGIQREVTGSTVSGDINVAAAQIIKAEMSSMSGSIVLVGALSEDGRITASSQSGNIDIAFSNNVSAAFDLATLSGDIRTNLAAEAGAAKQMLPGKSMHFTVGMGTGSIRCNNTSGNISVTKKE
jgi:DUF4097 and DUF4098 domain-containing protein YvlB